MQNLMKNITILVAWTYMVTCLAPYSPCYGNGTEVSDTVSAHVRKTIRLTDQQDSPSPQVSSGTPVIVEDAPRGQSQSYGTWFFGGLKRIGGQTLDVVSLFVKSLVLPPPPKKTTGEGQETSQPVDLREHYDAQVQGMARAARNQRTQLKKEGGLIPYTSRRVITVGRGAWKLVKEQPTVVIALGGRIAVGQGMIDPSLARLVVNTAVVARFSKRLVERAGESAAISKMALRIPRSLSTWVSSNPRTAFMLCLPFLLPVAHALNPDWDHPDPSLSRPYFGGAAYKCGNGEQGDSIELVKFLPGYTAMKIGCRAEDGSMMYNMVVYPARCADAHINLNSDGSLSFPPRYEGISDQSVQEYCAAPHRVLVISARDPAGFLAAPSQIGERAELPAPQDKEEL